jgi:hypothetical protein
MSEFENFEDDFAVEGEEQQASSPFLPLAGLLIAILVLTVICAAIVWFVQGPGQGGNGDQDQAFNATSTAVAIANATTLAQNAGVTATLLAMTEEASRPTATDTPEPEPPTEEATTPPTAEATETPVVDDGDDNGDGTEEPVVEGTTIFEDGDGDGTATPIPGTDGGTDTGSDGTLPDTGFGIAQAIAVGLGLLLVFIVARRLRTS